MARVLSLCSGYGGLEMALELAGVPVDLVAYAETDRWASRVMAAHHPDVPNLGDIKAIKGGMWPWQLNGQTIQILTAGYPCQPWSQAGLRRGANDPRHLWPNILTAIRALRPEVVFLENVRGHVARGLAQVTADLAYLGYVGSWGCVRAADVGAPHRRERVFVVAAYPGCQRFGEHTGGAPAEEARAEGHHVFSSAGSGWPTSDSVCEGRQGSRQAWPTGWEQFTPAVRGWERILRRVAPEPTVCRVDDGPTGRVGHISRTQQLKILGNGVVPQQAALAWRLLYPLTA